MGYPLGRGSVLLSTGITPFALTLRRQDHVGLIGVLIVVPIRTNPSGNRGIRAASDVHLMHQISSANLAFQCGRFHDKVILSWLVAVGVGDLPRPWITDLSALIGAYGGALGFALRFPLGGTCGVGWGWVTRRTLALLPCDFAYGPRMSAVVEAPGIACWTVERTDVIAGAVAFVRNLVRAVTAAQYDDEDTDTVDLWHALAPPGRT